MQYFFNDTIKKYTVAISHIINDIWIKKYDKNGALQKEIKVPITYHGKSRFYEYMNSLHSDFNANNNFPHDVSANIESLIPRIGFYDEAPIYDGARKKNNTIIYNVGELEIGEPVPYNIPWQISIITKDKQDMNQIVEQILTLFTPYLVINVNEIPELNIVSKIPILLDGVAYENETEFSGEDSSRVFITTLSLTLKGWMWPRIKDSKIIYNIENNIYNKDSNKLIAEINHEYDQLTQITTSTIIEYTS